jgi:alpha/beta superfamily hydrolase
MQLLMRRPETDGFISVSPPSNMYDFSFLAPCPASGLIVHGRNDTVSPEADVQKLVDRLNAQRGIKITQVKIEGANHFFDNHTPELMQNIDDYLDMRMPPVEEPA